MRNSVDSIGEMKNITGRRSIRDNDFEEIASRKKLNNNEDRSISEPPHSYSSYLNHIPSTSSRLKPIRERNNDNNQGSSDEDDLSKSNSQLNESDLDLEIPDSVSQTPTPTPLTSNARRINSETNLNDSKRRLTGFMGNHSKRFCASTSELSFTSHLDTHKSLFSPRNNNFNAHSRQSSLFGSNASLNSTNSRLFMVNSPFYNGKTTFGGASAYPKRDINQHKVLRTPVQMRPSSSLSSSSVTSTKSDIISPESNAAKRILGIMNQFSGDLKEARVMGSNINSMIKLPGLVQTQKRFGEEELSLERSISLSKPTTPYGRTISSATKTRSESPLFNLSHTKNTLQIPTMTQLLKMKRLQNNTERIREIANRSESFLNHIQEYKLPANDNAHQEKNSAASSLKMKSQITKNLLRNDKNINDLPPAPLNLPNIQLPELKSIPKFDIQLPTTAKSISNDSSKSISLSSAPQTVTTISVSQPTAKITTDSPKNSTNDKKGNGEFNFSSPIRLTFNDIDAKKLQSISEKFSFSKPLSIETVSTSKDTQELTKSLPITDNLFKNLVAQQKSQWECDSCMTRNDSEKTKCLCCESTKPDSGNAAKTTSATDKSKEIFSKSIAPEPDNLFKNLAAQQKKSQWECDACMTKNDVEKEKCVCCETPKPGSKPAVSTSLSSSIFSSSTDFKFGMPSNTISSSSPTTTTSNKLAPPASDDLFKNIAAQQKKSQWECDACMTKNDFDKDKCLCCETPKPGSKVSASSSTLSTPSTTFSFGIKPSTNAEEVKQNFSFGVSKASSDTVIATDTGFKSIIDKQNANWECSVCLTRNDPTRSKCICCEHTKPGASDASSQFSFGSNKVSAKPSASEPKFSFGVPSATITTDSKQTEKKEEQEVENSKDKIDEVDKPKLTFSFGAISAPAVKQTASEPVISPTFTFKALTTNSITASFSFKSPGQNEEKTVAEKVEESTKPTFSFGKSTLTAPETEKKITFGIDTKLPAEKISEPAVTDNSNRLGGFAFQTNVAPSTTSSGGFQFSSTPSLTFGSPKTSVAPAVTSNANSTSSFTFGGAPKTDSEATPSFGGFGSSSASSQVAQFSFSNPSAAAITPSVTKTATSSTIPIFGQSNSVMQTPTAAVSPFGMATANSNTTTINNNNNNANKDQSTQPSLFSFGTQKPAQNPPMIFGSASAPVVNSITPVFGSNLTPAPSFGSHANANNNNENAFGSKMMGFAQIANSAPQKRAFDFGSVQSDEPPKKFTFGSQQSQSQSAQPSSTPFQFNAQQNADARPAFNFSATSTPQTFNFTGSNTAINNTQENIFQFGANISTQGVLSFGTNQQPQQAGAMMQFGGTPNVAVSGINAFSAGQPSTASAAAQSRKILRAARRTTIPRR